MNIEKELPAEEKGEKDSISERAKTLSKKGIVIASVFGGVLVASLSLTLAIGFQELNKVTASPSNTWYKTVPGFYDESGKEVAEGGSFQFLKIDNDDTPYYQLTGVVLNKSGIKTLVLPSKHQSEGDSAAYSVYVIPAFSITNNLFGETDYDDSIESIYADGFFSSIGAYAFSGMKALEGIYLGSNASYSCAIDDFAFADDPTLKTISMPRSVTRLAQGVFHNDGLLSSLDLSQTGLVSLGTKASSATGAFENCAALASLTLPSTLLSIGDRSFYGTDALTSLRYLGIRDNFETAVKDSVDWRSASLTSVICSDGTIAY
jgi:hypothetical protein